jgi:trans-aconitate methyltransferase
MSNVINSWKNNLVFQKQLKFNLNELISVNNYPQHWIDFIRFIKEIKPKNILDIGCGCGAYYELCKIQFSNIEYTGIDYSKEAIQLAIKNWNYNNFFVKDYQDLNKEYIDKFDLIHLGAVLDVLPNGDEALEFILSLSAKNIIIGRMKVSEKPSYYETYTAYDEIITYSYSHNLNNFIDLCSKYDYDIYNSNNNYLLVKK